MTTPTEPRTPCRLPCLADHSQDVARGPRKAPPEGSGRQWCTGHSKRTGFPCQNWAIPGGTVCDDHGGRAKQVRAAAEARVAEQAAERAVTTYGLRRDVDPMTALLEEVQWTAGAVEWLRLQVQALEPEELVFGVSEVKGGDVTQKAAPSVWLELYQRERTHLTKVCGEAIRSGVAERQVRLAERQGALVASVLQSVLGALFARLEAAGVSEAVRAAWPGWVSEDVPRELRALGEGSGT